MGTTDYTLTLSNPNSVTVAVQFIQDTLPTGFTYLPGSTTGVTTADPTISGQTLTWMGAPPFQAPANGTLSLRFGVQVSNQFGLYYNNATASANGYTVTPTGDTAPIFVGFVDSVTLANFSSTSSGSRLPWLALGLGVGAGLLWLVRRVRTR